MADRADLDLYLDRLKRARTAAAYFGLQDGLEGVMRLADLQNAIAAVESVIAAGDAPPAAAADLNDILVHRDAPGEAGARGGFAAAGRAGSA